MWFVIVEIGFLLFVGFFVVTGPMALAAKSEGVDWDYFKRIKPGKMSFLFKASKDNPIKENGIIIPFFIMQLMSYLFVTAMTLGIAICLIFRHEVYEKSDRTIMIIGVCCLCGAFVTQFAIDVIAVILTKQRAKKLDNMKNDRIFKDK